MKHPRHLVISVWSLLALLLSFQSQAQTCTIVASTQKICLGNSVNFSANTSGLVNPTFQWNFGDNNTATLSSVSHVYANTGQYKVNLTVTHNGGTCTAQEITVNVFPLPEAGFVMQSPDSLCLGNAQLCILDTSKRSAANAPIDRRVFLPGDGSGLISTDPEGNPQFCYTYSDTGLFTLVMELEDSNGCASRQELIDEVQVFPEFIFDFNFSVIPNCGSTEITLAGDTGIDASTLRSFSWDFGDGQGNTTQWDTVKHDYTASGNYTVTLTATNEYGCTYTATKTINIVVTQPFTVDITKNRDSACFRNNSFQFVASPRINGAFYTWRFGDSRSAFKDTVSHNYRSCGTFLVSLEVRKGGCVFNHCCDTVEVMGPDAIMEIPVPPANIEVINKYQCTGDDTVKFVNPLPYLSQHCSKNPILRLWDFDDPAAPPCTTDTKNGINVGMNCNYSKDSANVWHKYPSGVSKCYEPKLRLEDSVTGCWDEWLGWDQEAGPTIRTVVTIGEPKGDSLMFTAASCLNQPIIYNLDSVQPSCNRETIWMNFDSACDANNWEEIKRLRPFNEFGFQYDSTCNDSGWVTFGMIIKNGDCYDTTWFHNAYRLRDKDAAIYLQRLSTCDYLEVQVQPIDSFQTDIEFIEWRWGDGTIDIDTLPPNYTVLPSRKHQFTERDRYTIEMTLVTDEGCRFTGEYEVEFGFYADFFTDQTLVCAGVPIPFIDSVQYYDAIQPNGIDTTRYWRAQNGTEILRWDFGDSVGFTHTGPLPTHTYEHAGIYTVRMEVRDRFGCLDTITKDSLLKVSEAIAYFTVPADTFVCGQIVQFFDSSWVEDHFTLSGGFPGSKINQYAWTFGDGKSPSTLEDPFHDYTTFGTFAVTLNVTSEIGCEGTYVDSIFIKGPQPLFTILSDTVGCVPYTVDFGNISKDVSQWIWYFGDGQTLSTSSDSNVTHTYNQTGIFEVSIFGEDSVLNPVTGFYEPCSATFPDPLSPNAPKFRIHVLPPPAVDFTMPDTVCANEPVVFQDNSDPIYTEYIWDMGNTDSRTATPPADTIIYSYSQTGSYDITYTPTYIPTVSRPLCPDTVVKTIHVVDVVADFTADFNEFSSLVKFTNQSQRTSNYEWDFGHPASGNDNFSNLENPTHDYELDTGDFIVCLKASNNVGCIDTTCKPVRNTFFIKLVIPNVFTPSNDDLFNDAFDIDIVGEESYELSIYNRWGELVYESEIDGEDNDGINWNGNNRNTGRACPAGTYFYVFKYQLKTRDPEVATGTVTLIRE